MIAALCLALAMYHEARSDGAVGMLAVGQVVMNRVEDRRWPDNACDVVKQGGEWPRHRCQFSFWCDGKSDRPTESRSWLEALGLARRMVEGQIMFVALSDARCYHATWIKQPKWAQDHIATIGLHRFYKCQNR